MGAWSKDCREVNLHKKNHYENEKRVQGVFCNNRSVFFISDHYGVANIIGYE